MNVPFQGKVIVTNSNTERENSRSIKSSNIVVVTERSVNKAESGQTEIRSLLWDRRTFDSRTSPKEENASWREFSLVAQAKPPTKHLYSTSDIFQDSTEKIQAETRDYKRRRWEIREGKVWINRRMKARFRAGYGFPGAQRARRLLAHLTESGVWL